jgi:hypothetical protein
MDSMNPKHSASASAVATNRLGYSLDSLAEATDASRSILYQELSSGRLRAKKLGARTIIPADEARRWLQSLPDFGSEQAA